MSYYRIYEEDQDNAIRNMLTVVGGGGLSYNAVLSVAFGGESPTEPVTLQEAKDWCRVDITDDDVLITKLIKAARRICEGYANISMIKRSVTAKINNGLGNFNLPYGPVIGDITSATDSNANDITTDFSLDTIYGNSITVVYTAGYIDGTLPEDLRTAILCQIAWMYNNRGDAKLATGLSLESTLTLQPLRNV